MNFKFLFLVTSLIFSHQYFYASNNTQSSWQHLSTAQQLRKKVLPFRPSLKLEIPDPGNLPTVRVTAIESANDNIAKHVSSIGSQAQTESASPRQTSSQKLTPPTKSKKVDSENNDQPSRTFDDLIQGKLQQKMTADELCCVMQRLSMEEKEREANRLIQLFHEPNTDHCEDEKQLFRLFLCTILAQDERIKQNDQKNPVIKIVKARSAGQALTQKSLPNTLIRPIQANQSPIQLTSNQLAQTHTPQPRFAMLRSLLSQTYELCEIALNGFVLPLDSNISL